MANGEPPSSMEGNRIFLVRSVFEYSSQMHVNFIVQGELVRPGGGVFCYIEFHKQGCPIWVSIMDQ